MRLQMHAIHFVADGKLLSFIQKKLEKLETFYDRITGGEVFLKLDKSEKNKVKNKILEVKIKIPGGELFVKENAGTFEEATDLALEALKIQIKKHKAKNSNGKAVKIHHEEPESEEVELDEV